MKPLNDHLPLGWHNFIFYRSRYMQITFETDELGLKIAALIQRKRPWPDQLKNYEWSKKGYEQTNERLSELAAGVRDISKKIQNSAPLTEEELSALLTFARDVFEWGRVERGESKENATGRTVRDVISAGLTWDIPDKSVPMDSGWTKVAAIASDYVEENGGTPQVIFDSRVAASLLTSLDKILERKDCDRSLKPNRYLPGEIAELGYVPGRGGTRKENGRREHKYKWPNRYQNWKGQFAASRLVAAIRHALNDNPEKFGAMPISESAEGPWTVRGVEMVLFMDGH